MVTPSPIRSHLQVKKKQVSLPGFSIVLSKGLVQPLEKLVLFFKLAGQEETVKIFLGAALVQSEVVKVLVGADSHKGQTDVIVFVGLFFVALVKAGR